MGRILFGFALWIQKIDIIWAHSHEKLSADNNHHLFLATSNSNVVVDIYETFDRYLLSRFLVEYTADNNAEDKLPFKH